MCAWKILKLCFILARLEALLVEEDARQVAEKSAASDQLDGYKGPQSSRHHSKTYRSERRLRHRRSHTTYEGSWQKLPELMQAQEDDNFCVSGRLLPRIFLLGVAKSATTSMAANLMSAGIESVGPDCRGWCHRTENQLTNVEKELHYFDFKMNWNDTASKPLLQRWSTQKAYWRELMPKCMNSSSGKSRPRRVLADFTPEYFRMVPLPDGSQYDNASMAHALFRIPHAMGLTPDLTLPSVLKAFYGYRLQRELTFIVMLREPLARMRSLYHCCVCPRGPHGPWAKRCQNTTFATDLRRHISLTSQDPPVYSDWMWGSFYGQHLRYWFDHMKARQFYVIPMRAFTKGDTDSICSDVSERLGFKMGCTSRAGLVTWLEHGAHSLRSESDLSASTVIRFRAIFDNDTSLLVKTLSTGYAQGTGLANYGGSGAPDDIEMWLKQSW